MMDEILFSHSYFLRFDPKQWSLGQPYPPLGTLYAAALMRERGYQVRLFDTMFVEDPEEVIEALDVSTPDFFVLYDDGFNYLTKMCLTNMRQAAFKMCKLAKERGCMVIVSSSDSTDRFSEYLSEGADFILLGEAEQTLFELTEAIKNGETDFQSVKGLAYLKGSQPVKTAARPVLKELDSLPLPAWDLVDMNLYRETWKKNAGYFSINMGTTRGCPYKCNWCAKPIYGNRYNSRSPQHVVSEIKLLKANYDIEHIWFCDDIFGLKPGWIIAFSRLLKEENINIRFKIQSRADLLIEDELVTALAAAGCENAWIGAESGSQKILDRMDKGITIEQIHRASRLMKKYGIKPSFFIQFGYPGETKQDIDLTIEMINALLPFEIGISVSYPLPGTVFYEKVKADLKSKTNWTDSDEMALMFSSTYPAYYYKQLHKYVHKNYRKHLAKNSFSNLVANPLTISGGNLKKALSVFYYTPLTYIEKVKLNRFEKTV
ncbi:B12-binding domain-containing radical SAM protein [Dyadobacter frigoris]|uniref:B12-binding domain-containing radical SAM protein n=1 Tax=Dyadobacter frigoris TaxID=2576211 RepID=A0A4U6D1V3_9BACT|nr:radical SAM protein [Dyadobacter frigoris]TKT90606.1 B12-binding domain-containing radical SAM protein [Dyadobacter frigoris]GLU51245.1 Mg-protoporphyrin IX monomethyl ester oxidative cyclase [Dyadobacter frigoris]